jgi:hypothetical protein
MIPVICSIKLLNSTVPKFPRQEEYGLTTVHSKVVISMYTPDSLSAVGIVAICLMLLSTHKQ